MVYYVSFGTTNPNYGIYIKGTNGYYYTSDEWGKVAGVTADCIAVITENTSFGIALTGKDDMQIYNDSYSSPNLPELEGSSTAREDYAGASNTAKLTAKYGTNSTYAAGYCANYSFPSGKKGYLGSLGQWAAAFTNKSAIDAAMSAAGGKTLEGKYLWSSSRGVDDSYGSCFFWYLIWDEDYDDFYQSDVISTFYALPFCEL